MSKDQPKASFPKKLRLARASEFAQVRQSGESATGKCLILGCMKADPTSPTKFGIITSKRLGNAVSRNRVRRRLREVVRLSRSQICEGLWLVLVARKAAVEASFEQLSQEWMRVGNRCSIFKR